MTVQRRKEIHFDSQVTIVAEAVRAALDRRPPYSHNAEQQSEAVFTTKFHKGIWAAAADMTIVLEPVTNGTTVVVTATSPKRVTIDIFGAYDEIIDELIHDLRWELEKRLRKVQIGDEGSR